ncbi:MAG: UPF0280 family protein [Hyphomicrobiaceae bacterium]
MSACRPDGAQGSLLPDGKRLHLHHGPIDLIVEAWGSREEIAAAYRQAQDAFADILTDLVDELALLRTPADQIRSDATGSVAQLMTGAVRALNHPVITPRFVTPMAAVAGAVAEHVLARAIEGRVLSRAYVNNGGDIALHIARGDFRIAIADNPASTDGPGTVRVTARDAVRGVATSGWRGRSQSLGIADAVTVLARSPAVADVAATLIGNAVDLPGSAKVGRRPANDIRSDSDLGDRLVTVCVGALSESERCNALDRGEVAAREFLDAGVIEAVFLGLQGDARTVARPHDMTASAADHGRVARRAGLRQALPGENRIQ